MPLRDDYAIFAYGLTLDDEDLACDILESAGDEFDIQCVGNDKWFVFYKESKMCVGSRLGTFSETRPERFYIPMTTIKHEDTCYPLSFCLHLWGP